MFYFMLGVVCCVSGLFSHALLLQFCVTFSDNCSFTVHREHNIAAGGSGGGGGGGGGKK